jgi:anti-sigma factor RsiW
MIENHINESDIEDYVAGILNEKERREIEAHAYQCTECVRSLMVSALSLRVHQRIRDLLLEDDLSTAAIV